MKKTSCRIVCLNLALVTLLSLSIPSNASFSKELANPVCGDEMVAAPQWAFAEDEYSVIREKAMIDEQEVNIDHEEERNEENPEESANVTEDGGMLRATTFPVSEYFGAASYSRRLELLAMNILIV